MKTFSKKIRFTAMLLAALTIALCFTSCALGGGDGRDVRTMREGTGTLAPATAEPTQPAVTTAPGSDVTGAVTTAAPGATTAPSGTQSPSVTTAAPDTAPETTTPVEIITYDYDIITVSEDVATSGSLKSTKTIRYPALTGLANTTIQGKINTLIGQIADTEFINLVENIPERLENGVTVRYEVVKTEVTYMGNNLLSVRSSGTVIWSDAAETVNFIYCNFFNLSTAKEIKPSNIYSDFGSIITLFTGGSFTRISGITGLESYVDRDTMIEEYRRLYLYNIYPETYFTSDSLVIAVEVAEQYGCVAEYSIPLTTVSNYLAMSPLG